jgi:hypothetical protein
MHGKFAICEVENASERPYFARQGTLTPLPKGIGSLLREHDLLAYGRFLYLVEL